MAELMHIAGVDEAGRGCLAGPVAVAAVILDTRVNWDDINDSKQLSAKARDEMAVYIRQHAVATAVVLIDPATIDRINILAATMLGMQRCIARLRPPPARVLIDGNRAPELSLPCQTIVGGDALEKCIGAASILAKTRRDEYMTEQARLFPDYGFARHKGYGTPEHLAALRSLGPTPLHRRSFAPVHDLAQGSLF